MRSRAVWPGPGSIGGSCGTEDQFTVQEQINRRKGLLKHLGASAASHFNPTYCETGHRLFLRGRSKFAYEVLASFVSSLILGVISVGDMCW